MVREFIAEHFKGRTDPEALEAAAQACIEKLSPLWETPKLEWDISVNTRPNGSVSLYFMPKILKGREILHDYDADTDEFVVTDIETEVSGRNCVELCAVIDLAKKMHWRIQ